MVGINTLLFLWIGLVGTDVEEVTIEITTTSANNTVLKSGAVSITDYYHNMQLADDGMDFKLFSLAVTGYQRLEQQGTLVNPILSIIDFTLPSNMQRMWVIDWSQKKLLYQTLVAHGRSSGALYAQTFSNEVNSNMSSVGFYLTENTYFGKHGLSLRLKGLEEGINNHAKARAIVIHGADYVSEDFVNKYGRLGRSLGCPALPNTISKEVIPVLANGSCLFIYGLQDNYLKSSLLLN